LNEHYGEEEWARIEWENAQMKEARLPHDARAATRRLLNAWAAVTVPSGQVETALEAFSTLVRGKALVVPDRSDERWEIARPGRIHARDTVRVKRDAYSDDAGRAHNGRRGRVVGVRYGDIIVCYEDGRQPPFEAVHHPPTKLEKLT